MTTLQKNKTENGAEFVSNESYKGINTCPHSLPYWFPIIIIIFDFIINIYPARSREPTDFHGATCTLHIEQ